MSNEHESGTGAGSLRSITDAKKKRLSGALGQGHFSIGDKPAGDAVIVERPALTWLNTDDMDLVYIDNMRRLTEAVSITSQVSIGGFGGRASASFGWVKNVSFENASVYLLLRRRIQSVSMRLRAPRLSDAAKALLERDDAQFLETYGDVFTSSVIQGGAVYVLVEISTTSSDEFEATSVSASGATGPVSGSVDFLQRVQKTAKSATFSFSLHQVGFAKTGAPLRRTGEDMRAYVDRIFDFIEGFAVALRDPAAEADLRFEYSSYEICENRSTSVPNFAPQNRVIDEVIDLLALIDRRQQSLMFAIRKPSYYEEPDLQLWASQREMLKTQRTLLERFARDLMADPATSEINLPVSASDFPPAPRPKPVPFADVLLHLVSANGRDHFGKNGDWVEVEEIDSVPNLPAPFTAIALSVAAKNMDLRVRLTGYSGTYLPHIGGGGPWDWRTLQSDGSRINAVPQILYGCFAGLIVELVGADADKYSLSVSAEIFTAVGDHPPWRLDKVQVKGGELIGARNDPAVYLTKLAVTILPYTV